MNSSELSSIFYICFISEVVSAGLVMSGLDKVQLQQYFILPTDTHYSQYR